MNNFFRLMLYKSLKKFPLFLPICALLLCFSFLYGENTSDPTQPESSMLLEKPGPGYTINFNNVSILEYIKFISKIANLNFVYNEKELNFNVTILSEEPTSLINVMSALIQVLKINGFSVVEQGNNLLITKSGVVRQIATVVSQENPLEGDTIPPILTRVFRIKNANPTVVGSLIAPLLSSDAILEVSAETRHLIITDITQNIDQVQKLLLSLDAAKSPLDINSYSTRNHSPENLISLANQIITPISEGNPVIFVPQAQTNTIFIVSTPYLIEKSLMIFEDLDNPPSLTQAFSGPITGKNILIYHIENKPADVLQAAIKKMESHLTTMGPGSQDLVKTLDTMRYIRESHSLLFVGSSSSLSEVEAILRGLDVPFSENELEFVKGSYFIYPIKYGDEDQIARSLEKLVENLKKSPHPDKNLIKTIDSMKWIKENNSLMFTGDRYSIDQLKQLLPTFDIPFHQGKTASKLPPSNDFYVYTPKNISGEELLKQIKDVEKTLKKASLSDPAFLHTLSTAEWVSSTHSLVFTGDASSLDRVHALLNAMDQVKGPSTASTYFVYKVKFAPPDYIEQGLQKLAKSLSKSNPVVSTIDNSKYISETNSFVFEGPTDAIDQIKDILSTLDTSSVAQEETSQFYVYKPENLTAQQYLDRVKDAAKELKSGGLTDSNLLQAMQGARLTSDKSAVMFTGNTSTVNKVRELAPTFDTGDKESVASEYYVYQPVNLSASEFKQRMIDTAESFEDSGLADPSLIRALKTAQIASGGKAVLFIGPPSAIERIKEMTQKYDQHEEGPAKANDFYVYTPRYMSAEDVRDHARLFADNMESSGFADSAVIKALNNAKIVSHGKSVLFTGTPSAIASIKQLLPTIDQGKEEVETSGKTTFLIYKIQHVPGPPLMSYLRDLATDLERAGSPDKDLIQTLKNMRYVKETNSIIFTGPNQVLEQARALAEKFDIAELAGEQPVRSPSGYLIYKPKYVPGEQLILILRDFEQNLISSGVSDPSLFDTINNLKWMQQVSSILISGEGSDTQQVYSLLERFDIPGPGIPGEDGGIETISDASFLIYKLQYHSGSEIQSALQKIGVDLGQAKNDKNKQGLVEAIKALQWVEVTNSLISTGESDSLAKLKELIKSIDTPLKQVFVEILVIETSISNTLNFGLRWASQGVYREKFAYGTSSIPQLPTSGTDPLADFNTNLSSIDASTTPTGSMIPFTTGFDLGVIGDIILHKGKSYFALGSLIDAIKGDSDSTVALNQKIITQDNKNATIFVGQNIPYTGSIVTNISQNTVSNANLEYRDIGMSLSITPQVGDNDTITLNINEEITEQVGDTSTTNTSTTTLNGITTNKTTTQTSVTVPDKSFLILSGQIDNTNTKTRTSIPCLGGLPIIGAAFSQNDTTDTKNSVIIFVRPHIIKSFDVYKEITEHQENLHRAQTDDEETFDAGLELVKTPDDY